MPRPRTVEGSAILLCALASLATPAHAQTIDDGVLMAKNQLCTGFLYAHDSWSQYWEGPLQRSNGNIGTITTQSVSWVGSYGVSDRLNVIAMLPYVRTHASAGVLSDMSGLQDATFAVKYNFLTAGGARSGSLRGIAVVAAATPASDYTPDFLPLSIGIASPRLSGRLTLGYRKAGRWFAEGSAAYTWRGNVTLDRPSYYTDGHLYLSDEVAMPDVFDYVVRVGFVGKGLMLPISFSQQVTRGGGDIRRQDMPFVSNRMDASRIAAMVLYDLPRLKNLSVHVDAAYTVSGRNVGQSTTWTGGLLYRTQF